MGCVNTKSISIAEQTISNINEALIQGGCIRTLPLRGVGGALEHTLRKARIHEYSFTENEKRYVSLYLAIQFIKKVFGARWDTSLLGFYDSYSLGVEYHLPEHSIGVILQNYGLYVRRFMQEIGGTENELEIYLNHTAETFLWNRYIVMWLYDMCK